jgi:endonuclease/exonuclease/phosphatase family metal-dependent hydrolase
MKLKYLFIAFVALVNTNCSSGTSPESPPSDTTQNTPHIENTHIYTKEINVKWKEIAGAKKYEVRYATKKDMSNAKVKETTSVSLDITGLQSATSYYIQTRAYIDAEWGQWSEVKTYKTATFTTTVETYNVMNDSAYYINHDHSFYEKHHINGMDAWTYRREAFKKIILAPDNSPDILALQEVRKDSQVEDISSLLKDKYNGYIDNRKFGEGERQRVDPRAIFWKKDKYSLMDSGDIDALGNTIKGYDSKRYVTYVQLKNKANGKELIIYNLHPSAGHSKKKQRLRHLLATNIAKRAKVFSSEHNAIAIVMGDFNNYPETVIGGYLGAPLTMKSAGFPDTFDEAADKKNINYKSNDDIFDTEPIKSPGGSKRIDYIFTYPENRVTVSDYRIVFNFKGNTTKFKLPRPSDHHPVRSTLHLFY